MKIFLNFSIFILLLSSCNTANKEVEKEKILEQSYAHAKIGVALMEAKNYPGALEQLLRAHELNPMDVAIINNLALAYFYRGRSDLAIQRFQQALKLAPGYTDAKVNMGRVYIENKNYAKALVPLLEASKDLTYPAPEKIHTNLGIAYFHLSDLPKAQVQFAKALQSDRNYCLAILYNTKSLFEMKKFFRANQSADHGIYKCDEKDYEGPIAELYFLSGMSFYFMNQTNKAQNRLHALVRKYPNSEYTIKANQALQAMKSQD